MRPAPSARERLRAQLADLKMPGALEALDDILRQIDGGSLTAPAALAAVLGAQISLRNNRRLVAAMRSSRLPAVKTLADFDFSFQPSLKREQIDHLHTLGFAEKERAGLGDRLASLAAARMENGSPQLTDYPQEWWRGFKRVGWCPGVLEVG